MDFKQNQKEQDTPQISEKAPDQFHVFRDIGPGLNQIIYQNDITQMNAFELTLSREKFYKTEETFFNNLLERLRRKNNTMLSSKLRLLERRGGSSSQQTLSLKEIETMNFFLFVKILDWIKFSQYYDNTYIFINALPDKAVQQNEPDQQANFWINMASVQTAIAINSSISYFCRKKEKNPNQHIPKITYLSIQHTINESLYLNSENLLRNWIYRDSYQGDIENSVLQISLCSHFQPQQITNNHNIHLHQNSKIFELERMAKADNESFKTLGMAEQQNYVETAFRQALREIEIFQTEGVILIYSFDMENENSQDGGFIAPKLFCDFVEKLVALTNNHVAIISTSENPMEEEYSQSPAFENIKSQILKKMSNSMEILSQQFEIDYSNNRFCRKKENLTTENDRIEIEKQNDTLNGDQISSINGNQNEIFNVIEEQKGEFIQNELVEKKFDEELPDDEYFQHKDLDQAETWHTDSSQQIQNNIDLPYKPSILGTHVREESSQLEIPLLDGENEMKNKSIQLFPVPIAVQKIEKIEDKHPPPIHPYILTLAQRQSGSSGKLSHITTKGEIILEKSITFSIEDLVLIDKIQTLEADTNYSCVRYNGDKIEIYSTLSQQSADLLKDKKSYDPSGVYSSIVDLKETNQKFTSFIQETKDSTLKFRFITCDDEFAYLINGYDEFNNENAYSTNCERINLKSLVCERINSSCDSLQKTQQTSDSKEDIFLFCTKDNIFYGGVVVYEDDIDLWTLKMQVFDKQKNHWYQISQEISTEQKYIFSPGPEKNSFYQLISLQNQKKEWKKNDEIVYQVQLVQLVEDDSEFKSTDLGYLKLQVKTKQKEYILTSNQFAGHIIISKLDRLEIINILDRVSQTSS